MLIVIILPCDTAEIVDRGILGIVDIDIMNTVKQWRVMVIYNMERNIYNS